MCLPHPYFNMYFFLFGVWMCTFRDTIPLFIVADKFNKDMMITLMMMMPGSGDDKDNSRKYYSRENSFYLSAIQCVFK